MILKINLEKKGIIILQDKIDIEFNIRINTQNVIR